jgi:branched-chain amino acid transport system permease protein
VLLRALTACVIARMDNIPVAVAAAVGISIFEQSVFWAVRQSSIVDAVLLGVIVVSLLLQRGRLGRVDESATSTWAATEEIRGIPSELATMPQVKRGVRRALWLLAAAILVYPWVMSPSQTNLGALYAIYGIIGISLVTLTGWAGQISLGQFGFVCVGAVVGGATTGRWDLPFPVALVLGTAVAAGVAVVVGLPALRIRGLFLAVTTLAFAMSCSTVLLNPDFFGWLLPARVSRPVLLWFDSNTDERTYYYLCAAALGAAIFVVQGLRKTRTGRLLIAMRDNERTAQSHGANLVRNRLTAFALSGGLAGFAGVLYAHHQAAVSPQAFGPEQSIQMFLMAVIGGLGSITGALLGAIYLGTVNLVIGGSAGRLLASGGGFLAVLLFYPGGLGAALYAARDAWLRRIAMLDRIFVPSQVGDFRVLVHQPGDREQQAEPHHERGGEAHPARFRLLIEREFPGQDRDEDDVVDAEHDFHRGERRQADPAFGGEEHVEHGGGAGLALLGRRKESITTCTREPAADRSFWAAALCTLRAAHWRPMLGDRPDNADGGSSGLGEASCRRRVFGSADDVRGRSSSRCLKSGRPLTFVSTADVRIR